MNNCERSLDLNTAFLNWKNELIDLGFDFEIACHGAPIETNICSLINKSDRKNVATGFGKGLGLQSQLSACFEALEHLYMPIRNTTFEVSFDIIDGILQTNPLCQ